MIEDARAATQINRVRTLDEVYEIASDYVGGSGIERLEFARHFLGIGTQWTDRIAARYAEVGDVSLNGYRVKERVPDNIDTFTVPLGIPEVLRQGSDATIVTYGALCRIALEAAAQLELFGMDVEVIDVQTLNPLDRNHSIVESIKKTNAVIFLDEDVPGRSILVHDAAGTRSAGGLGVP